MQQRPPNCGIAKSAGRYHPDFVDAKVLGFAVEAPQHFYRLFHSGERPETENRFTQPLHHAVLVNGLQPVEITRATLMRTEFEPMSTAANVPHVGTVSVSFEGLSRQLRNANLLSV